MRQAHGEWLREQRRARGWAVPEMRRRLRQAAEESGDRLPANPSLTVMIHRWEDDRSGISQRYRLHYSRALGIPYEAFGKTPTEQQAPEPRPRPPGPVSADAALLLAEAALMLLAALQACGMVPDLTAPDGASDLAGRIRAARRGELTGGTGH